jgi:hypothetical protein
MSNARFAAVSSSFVWLWAARFCTVVAQQVESALQFATSGIEAMDDDEASR